MMYAKYLCWLFLCNLIFSGFCLAVSISEVHPVEEYIEIFAEESTDTTGWKYSEMTSSGKENFYTLPFSHISAEEYLVISLSNKINDTGDTIRLYNEKNEKQDEISIPAKKEGKSYTFLNGEWLWEAPSRGIENTPIPTPTPSNPPEEKTFPDIIISEMLANPEGVDGGENEFFELFNPTEESVSLDRWTIQDASGKMYAFENILLDPGEYKVFYRSQSGITLNNDAETLRLFAPNGEEKSTLSFSSAQEENQSWGKTEDRECAGTPSPNAKNVGCVFPPATNTLSEENILFPKTSATNPVRLQIEKISPNATPDSISVRCMECNTDIAGIRLGIDGVAYTIPANVYAENNDILRFVFEKDSQKPPEKLGNGWIFFVPVSGLSVTDESIFLLDGNAQIIDGMCYANRNNYLEGKEKKDIAMMILQHQWQGGVNEYDCVNASVVPKNAFILRKKEEDTNTASDFFIQFSEDFENNGIADVLQFALIIASVDTLEGEVINTGSQNISLENVGLYDGGKELFLFEKTMLLPHQKLVFRIPLEKKKSWSLDGLLLELRSEKMELLDAACFNWNDEATLSNLQKQRLNDAITAHKWTIDFNTPKCFSQFSSTPKAWQKIDFTKQGVASYEEIKEWNPLFRVPEKKKTEKPEKTKAKKEPKKNTSKMKKNEKNEIALLQIAKILPNPDGTDGGKEAIEMVNLSPRAGFARNWKLKIERNGKISEKNLPNIFLLPNESRILQKPFLPSFANSDTIVFLINPWGEEVQKIHWEKAREEEWFGPKAPPFVEKKKAKKTAKKKKSSKKTMQPPAIKIPDDIWINGEILFVDKETLLIWGEDGNWYAMKFPDYLPSASEVFQEKRKMRIHLKKGKLKDIAPIFSEFSQNITQNGSIVSGLFSVGALMGIGGLGIFFGKRRKRKISNI